MNRFGLIFLVLLFVSVLGSGQSDSAQKFYVGTFTSEGAEGVYLCEFNSKSGEIVLKNTFKGIDNPSFLKLSPDKEFLYVVSRATPEIEKTGGFVNAYKVGNKGDLKFLNKQVSNGSGPCHVDVSPKGKFVAIATYGGGTTSVYPVKSDGSIESPISIIKNTGRSVVEGRQDNPHAHSIKFSKSEPTIFSADLGTDQLNIYHFDDGNLGKNEQEYVKLPVGAGPRHFEFHPNGDIIYVINELNSTISAVRKEGKEWNIFQNISTLPENFEGISYCADIHISKDGKYLYGSNRGHNSIAVFEVNRNNKSLKMIGTVPVEGDWPRNFGITPDGKWMLVANQKSHNITIFRINKDAGIPEFTGKKFELPAPVCIEFL